MKTLKILTTFFTFVLAFFSCEEESIKAVLKSDVQPNELQTPSSPSFVLLLEDKDEVLEKFKWTATDFGFQASITYEFEMDVAENGFDNAVVVATTNSLEEEILVGAFNDQLLGLGLNPDEAALVELRVVSTVNSKVPSVISNVQTITVTPFATSFPPIYGMGAGLKGWGPWPDNAVEWQSSEFKKYETTAYFTNDAAFRFFDQLDWGPVSFNYTYFSTVDPLFVNAGDGDSNLKLSGATGWYKVNVNLKDKILTAVAVSEPVLYMTGAGTGGWDTPGTGASVKMTYLKPGVFTVQTTFSNGAFRFFGQADWGPVSYNYPYFVSVPSDFENANDGDQNLNFVGTPGSKKITVDLNEKVITLGDPPLPKLYMMGDALNGWGPWNDKEVELTYKSPGVFEATATFTNNGAFRFFGQADWGPTSYNYPYFTTVHSDFANAGDGDSNFRYVGTTGSRTITVNLTTKVVSLN